MTITGDNGNLWCQWVKNWLQERQVSRFVDQNQHRLKKCAPVAATTAKVMPWNKEMR